MSIKGLLLSALLFQQLTAMQKQAKHHYTLLRQARQQTDTALT